MLDDAFVTDACYETPSCENQTIDLEDTHGVVPHDNNTSLFNMTYPKPSGHFLNFR